MKRTARYFIAVACAALVASAPAGCSGPPAAPDASQPLTNSATGVVPVTLWSWQSNMDKYVAAFNSSHPDIQVKLQVIPSGLVGGYAQETNAIKAGNAPDILHVEYQALPQILQTGGLRDISSATADMRSQYAPSSWNNVTLGGKTYALPFDQPPMVLYYRKDLFEQNNIPVPTSWDQYRQAATRIKAINAAARILAFQADGSYLAGLSWQTGQPWWSFTGDKWSVRINNAGTSQTAAYWQSMILDGLVSVAKAGTQEWIDGMHTGTLWTYLGASWGSGTIQRSLPTDTGRWAATTLPTFTGQPSGSLYGGSAYAVSKSSPNSRAAFEFVKWLSTSPEPQKILAQSGAPFPAYIPNQAVARAATNTSYFTGENLYDVFTRAQQNVPTWTWGPNSLTVFDQLANAFVGLDTSSNLVDKLGEVQTKAVSDLRGLGLSVDG